MLLVVAGILGSSFENSRLWHTAKLQYGARNLDRDLARLLAAQSAARSRKVAARSWHGFSVAGQAVLKYISS